MMIDDDLRKMRLDYLSELGDLLVSGGAAIAAAAGAERIDVLEMSLRFARNTIVDAITTFRSLEDQGGEHGER